MSSESSSPYGDLSRFNFTGGFPTSKDLAPSIIFLIIYVAAIPFLGWRLFSAKHRDWILIRPAIFLSCRLGMLGLRAWMSKNTYGEGELIAELVLVSIGYLFLMDPIIGLWRRHVAAAVSKEEAPRWVNLLSTGLKLALLGAIGTAVAGSAQISGAISDPSKVDGVVTLRKTSAFLALAVSVLACLAIVLTHFEFRLDARRTFFLIPCTVALMIISIFRVLQIYSKNPNAGIRKPVAFWIMQMLMELIVFIALLGISIPLWFPKPKKNEGQDGKDVEMGQAERISSHSK